MFPKNTNQTTNTIVMVRPANFGFNTETAVNNAFQTNDESLSIAAIQEQALKEFDAMVEKLRNYDIDVLVIDDTKTPVKTDAVFPNNWFTSHEGGYVVTYPMFSPNRRQERREDIIEEISNSFVISKRYSFDYYEEKNQFLEGTGSMILDRENNKIYACLSERTNIKVLEKFAVLSNYDKLIFHATDPEGMPIYHTNVIMSLGKDLVIICLDSIGDMDEKKAIINSLQNDGKEIIDITFEQVKSFAGNMLELKKTDDSSLIVMSEQAFHSLEPEQINQIKSRSDFMYADIPAIEKYGGGSVRCMIAEVFLDKKME